LPYLTNREQWYAQVVKKEVLAKHHRALLIMVRSISCATSKCRPEKRNLTPIPKPEPSSGIPVMTVAWEMSGTDAMRASIWR
jgi:hypothetical protein